LFRLAVANNLGVLFTQLNESAHAAVCFQNSMSILDVFVAQQAQDLVPDFEGYLNNVARLSRCTFGVIAVEAA